MTTNKFNHVNKLSIKTHVFEGSHTIYDGSYNLMASKLSVSTLKLHLLLYSDSSYSSLRLCRISPPKPYYSVPTTRHKTRSSSMVSLSSLSLHIRANMDSSKRNAYC